MKNGNKLRFMLCLLFFAAAVCLTLPVRADGGVASVSSASCYEDEEVEVVLSISEPFNAAQISVYFWGNTIEFVRIEAENTTVNSQNNSIEIVTLPNDAELHQMSYTLVFRGKQAGSSPVGISNIKLSDGSQNPISLSSVGEGTITVEPAPTEPPTEPPTEEPTEAPTEEPTEAPTEEPTEAPTEPPTEAPTDPPAPVVLSLSSVYFEGGDLTPAFDPDITDYTVQVPAGTTWLRHSYQLTDGRATSYYWPYSEAEPGTWVFSQGEEMVIRVLTPDQSEYVDYSFVLEPPETEAPTEAPTERQPSHDAALYSLRLEGSGALSPAFDPEQLNYRQEIDPSVSALRLLYQPRDGGASAYSNILPDNIPYGETELVVHVTAEDGYTTRDYHVTIVRPYREDPTETDPEETEPESTEPATEETTEPESTEPVTEEPTEAPAILESLPLFFKVLPIPEDAEIPAGYVVKEMKTDDGAPYEALVPESVRRPDHYVLYGVRMKEADPEETEPAETGAPAEEDPSRDMDETAPPARILVEDGTPGFYLYDLKEGTLQRMGLLAEPETEAPTEAPETTEAPTEPPTEPATRPEPTAPVPTETQQTPTSAVPPTTEADRSGSGSGRIPWWIFAVIAVMAGAGAFAILALSRDKKRLQEELKTHGTLSADEEEAFLSMNSGSLYSVAKETNSPWTVEDLDPVLEEKFKENEADAPAEELTEAESEPETPAGEGAKARTDAESPSGEDAEAQADAEIPAGESAEAQADADTSAEENADAGSGTDPSPEGNAEAEADPPADAENSLTETPDADPETSPAEEAPAEKTDKEAPEA
ncbi:MAG: cadherin-like beta sandwich domain-containing protein [Lachnospiraceae bacterium]|nr:cadherin-like beta sandwich domain-containing protein [Lachnospiraceae bacterium]